MSSSRRLCRRGVLGQGEGRWSGRDRQQSPGQRGDLGIRCWAGRDGVAACAGSPCRNTGTSRSPCWGPLRQELWSPLGSGMGSVGGCWGQGSVCPLSRGGGSACMAGPARGSGWAAVGLCRGCSPRLIPTPPAWGQSRHLLPRHGGTWPWLGTLAAPAVCTPEAPWQ